MKSWSEVLWIKWFLKVNSINFLYFLFVCVLDDVWFVVWSVFCVCCGGTIEIQRRGDFLTFTIALSLSSLCLCLFLPLSLSMLLRYFFPFSCYLYHSISYSHSVSHRVSHSLVLSTHSRSIVRVSNAWYTSQKLYLLTYSSIQYDKERKQI